MKILFVVIVAFGLCRLHASQGPLNAYLADNSDISVVNYTLLQTINSQSNTVYVLNFTSLKWFNGN